MSIIVENFYLFFEGIMLFQVLYFGMVYLLSGRKDVLFYSLLNLVTAAYFFLNAPDTFLHINENIVFNSDYYTYINYSLILLMELMYLLFLKEIFSDSIQQSPALRHLYKLTLFILPCFYITFSLFYYNGLNTDYIFYAGYMVNGPFCTWILIKNLKAKGTKSYIVTGMIIIFLCLIVTIWFTLRYNAGKQNFVLDHYPLLPIKIGMLIDLVLFQLALTKRWQLQENELAMQQLRADIEIEKVKNRINTELHDDVGSTLSGISMYSRLAMQKAGDSPIIDILTVIQQTSDETVNRLKDIVWINNPGSDSTLDMLERLKDYAEMMSRTQKIEIKLSCDAELIVKKIPEEIRYHFYLIGKEAVNNAIKYSQATIININFLMNNLYITLQITDNGCGFDIDSVKKGNGLENIVQRSKSIQATCKIESNFKKGTHVAVSVKIPL